MKFNLVVCGGTFDHFHKGHREFLNYAFSISKKIIIGLTSDEYVETSKLKSQNSNFIESYEVRKKSLEEFLSHKKVQDKVVILKIDDLYGSTLSKDFLIDAIVVSEESKKGADIINQKRKELGLQLLKVFVASPIRSEDGKLISSTRIRKGEINREGELYVNPLWLMKDLILPADLKEELKKPFGDIITDNIYRDDNASYVITVGDATTKKFNENFIGQNISVIDFKIAREEVFSSFSDLGFSGNETTVMSDNPAGHITRSLFSKVLEIFGLSFDRKVILKIVGEEDLVVLPLILAAPLGTIIYYGQPGIGLVKIFTSENSKKQAYNLVKKFRPI
jgi:pantetheine-phosphate adenylyltransferase